MLPRMFVSTVSSPSYRAFLLLTLRPPPWYQSGDGQVPADKLKKILDASGGWVGDKRTMQTVLLALRNQLRSKSLPKQQPPDGTTYS